MGKKKNAYNNAVKGVTERSREKGKRLWTN